MKKLYFASAILALAASSQADWAISDFAYPTKDSTETATLYGAQPFLNSASKGLVTVPAAGGYISFNASTIASDPATAPKGNAYSANVGLMVPLMSDWSIHDLTGLTSIDFEFRNSDLITGSGLEVSFGSTSIDSAFADSGQTYIYTYTDDLTATTTWRPISITPDLLLTPDWWTTKPKGFPTMDSLLKNVKNIQFAPKTAYTSSTGGVQIKEGGVSRKCGTTEKCVVPDMTKQTLDVRNIVLKGVEKWPMPNPEKVGCSGTPLLIDDFSDGNAKGANLGLGYWYGYSDSADVPDTTKAKGSSSAVMEVMAPEGGNVGYVMLNTQLRKKIGTAWQDYAGWGAVGIDFRTKDTADLSAVTGIEFQVGPVPSHNGKIVETVTFKLAQSGVADADAFYAEIPYDKLGSGKTVCLRPEDIKQPTYVKNKVPLNLKKISRLSWEAKITDNKNSLIDTATAGFFLTDVKLYGIDKLCLQNEGKCYAVGVSSRPSINFGFNYKSGSLNLSGFNKVDGFEVVSIDGTKLSSFAPVASKKLDLARGTYFLVAKSGSLTTARQFVVTDR